MLIWVGISGVFWFVDLGDLLVMHLLRLALCVFWWLVRGV